MFTNFCLVPPLLFTRPGKWYNLAGGVTLSNPPPTSRTGPKSPRRNSSTTSAEDFYNSFYYNEGLENKLTGAPLLGLAKYIYYLMEFNIKQNLKDSTQI